MLKWNGGTRAVANELSTRKKHRGENQKVPDSRESICKADDILRQGRQFDSFHMNSKSESISQKHNPNITSRSSKSRIQSLDVQRLFMGRTIPSTGRTKKTEEPKQNFSNKNSRTSLTPVKLVEDNQDFSPNNTDNKLFDESSWW